MKKSLLLVVCYVFLSFVGSGVQGGDLLKYVDPYIGTGGHGHVFLGSSVPFGAVQVGPNNIHKGWDWCSGYHYSDSVLIGFGHLHLSGTGCTDLGDILVMPVTGNVGVGYGSQENPDSGYASRYNHGTEVARPEYYSVMLDDYDIKVELTATERVALHRYTFPKDELGKVIVNLADGNGDSPRECFIKKIDENTFGGYRFSQGWAPDQRVFFAIQTSENMDGFDVYVDDKMVNADSAKSKNVKGMLKFKAGQKEVMLKVAISPISIENAIKNIDAEIDHWNFKKVVNYSKKKWNEQLNKFELKADKKTKRIFYTAFYHTMISPVLFNDSNGDYRGADKNVFEDPDFVNYSIFSLWDTYRTQHPLLTIVQPERVDDMINSMLVIYDHQGYLPIWHLMGNETHQMVGYSAVPVVVDAYFKGFKGFDAERAYEAVKGTAMYERDGVKELKERGYIPGDMVIESVAKAMEYAISDGCIALMAKDMGKMDDYEYFLKRSKAYAQYFDKTDEFMKGKMADGSWREPFDPIAASHRVNDYCEGNAWQYTWLVPHDPAGLIELFGSEGAYLKKLDTLFSMSSELKEGASADISGLIGQYAHGNEPSHHTIYMFAFAGEQWKSAEQVRKVLSTLYTDEHDGLSGNEDCGQMSAWYIMSSMGFYPVHPANGVYVMGSPNVDELKVDLPNGKKFVVKAKKNSDDNIYIQSVKYNGKPYNKSYITHDMIMSGGKLEFVMGDEPNKEFGAGKSNRP